MPIKFSPCATNPCVAAELWTRPDQVVHHDQTKPCAHPSRAKQISKPRPHKPPRRAPVQAIVTDRQAAHMPEHSAVHTLNTHAVQAVVTDRRAVHTPEHSVVHTLDTRTRPCICLSTPTVLPKLP